MSLDQLEKSEQVFAAQPNLVFACSANKKGLGNKVSGKEMTKECSLKYILSNQISEENFLGRHPLNIQATCR